jgi:hypothetical protein
MCPKTPKSSRLAPQGFDWSVSFRELDLSRHQCVAQRDGRTRFHHRGSQQGPGVLTGEVVSAAWQWQAFPQSPTRPRFQRLDHFQNHHLSTANLPLARAASTATAAVTALALVQAVLGDWR